MGDTKQTSARARQGILLHTYIIGSELTFTECTRRGRSSKEEVEKHKLNLVQVKSGLVPRCGYVSGVVLLCRFCVL